MNDIIIKKVNTINECLSCNKMLEELIKFESKLDTQINGNTTISDFYERTLNKDDSVIFIALYDNKPIGYIMAYKQKEKASINDNVITIMNIYIKQEHRNKHIGKLLMQEIENWAKTIFNNFVIELDCVSNNINAIEFYKKLNYKPVRVKMRKSFNTNNN